MGLMKIKSETPHVVSYNTNGTNYHEFYKRKQRKRRRRGEGQKLRTEQHKKGQLVGLVEKLY